MLAIISARGGFNLFVAYPPLFIGMDWSLEGRGATRIGAGVVGKGRVVVRVSV